MVKLHTYRSHDQVSVLFDLHGLIQLVDQILDHVRVLRIQLQRRIEGLKSEVLLAQLLVNLADHYENGRLLWHDVTQLLKHVQGVWILFQSHEDGPFLVFVQRVQRVNFFGPLEESKRLARSVAVVARHASVGPQRCQSAVDLSCVCKALLRIREVVLLVGYVSQTPPSVVVSLVYVKCHLEVVLRLFIVFV